MAPAKPARPSYTAATLAEAVAWLAAALHRGDDDAADQATAAPLGVARHDWRVAHVKAEEARRKYVDARNARSRTFSNPAADRFAKEQKEMAARERFVVQKIEILEETPVGNSGDVVALVVRVFSENRNGEKQSPRERFYALRQAGVWKLLREPHWRLLQDDVKMQAMLQRLQDEMKRLEELQDIYEKSLGRLNDGQPVIEVDLTTMAEVNRVLAKEPEHPASKSGPEGGAESLRDLLK